MKPSVYPMAQSFLSCMWKPHSVPSTAHSREVAVNKTQSWSSKMLSVSQEREDHG